jgi:hypothetical protein
MKTASATTAMQHPSVIFAGSDNNEAPSAVVLKRQDSTNNVNGERNIYGEDGTVVNDSKSIFF